MRLRTFVCITLVATSIAACAKKNDGAPAEAAVATSEASGASPVDAPVPALPSDGLNVDTGIPECDDYLTKMLSCAADNADKTTAEERELFKANMKQLSTFWATTATADKPSRAAECRADLNGMSDTFAKLGCSF
ncbi:hypothetical protein [Lysobacter terrae]